MWDIVEELVNLNVSAPPANPFAINFDVLAELPPLERALQAGAVAGLLRDLLLGPCACAEELEADLQRCIELHFAEMPALVPAVPGTLPPEYLERIAAA